MSEITTLYTPGAVFMSTWQATYGVSSKSKQIGLDQTTMCALGFADAIAHMSREYQLGLDISHEEQNGFAAAWRQHVAGYLSGTTSHRMSLDNAWRAWRANGRVDANGTYTRSNIIVDAKTGYGLGPIGVLYYEVPDGTRYNVANVVAV